MGAGVSKLPDWYPGEPTGANSGVRQAGPRRGGWSPIGAAPDGGEENERTIDRLPEVDLADMEYIACGAFCAVYTCKYRGRSVVAKRVREDLPQTEWRDAMVTLWNEYECLRQLDHPNIIEVYGMCRHKRPADGTAWNETDACLLLERLALGTVGQLLGTTRCLEDNLASSMARARKMNMLPFRRRLDRVIELAHALDFVHGGSGLGTMMHRDIKSANVGFAQDGSLKLMDFGLSRVVAPHDALENDTYKMTGEVGSFRYMAPELVRREPYNAKADIYSWAILSWEILAVLRPYNTVVQSNFVQRVVMDGERPEMQKRWPDGLCSLLSSAWHADFNERPTATGVVAALNTIKAELQASGTKRLSVTASSSGDVSGPRTHLSTCELTPRNRSRLTIGRSGSSSHLSRGGGGAEGRLPSSCTSATPVRGRFFSMPMSTPRRRRKDSSDRANGSSAWGSRTGGDHGGDILPPRAKPVAPAPRPSSFSLRRLTPRRKRGKSRDRTDGCRTSGNGGGPGRDALKIAPASSTSDSRTCPPPPASSPGGGRSDQGVSTDSCVVGGADAGEGGGREVDPPSSPVETTPAQKRFSFTLRDMTQRRRSRTPRSDSNSGASSTSGSGSVSSSGNAAVDNARAEGMPPLPPRTLPGRRQSFSPRNVGPKESSFGTAPSPRASGDTRRRSFGQATGKPPAVPREPSAGSEAATSEIRPRSVPCTTPVSGGGVGRTGHTNPYFDVLLDANGGGRVRPHAEVHTVRETMADALARRSNVEGQRGAEAWQTKVPAVEAWQGHEEGPEHNPGGGSSIGERKLELDAEQPLEVYRGIAVGGDGVPKDTPDIATGHSSAAVSTAEGVNRADNVVVLPAPTSSQSAVAVADVARPPPPGDAEGVSPITRWLWNGGDNTEE